MKRKADVKRRTPIQRAAKPMGGKTVTAQDSSGTINHGDWRRATLNRIRALIQQADPDAVEEVKWRKPSNPAGVPVWSHEGIICTGETYKAYVKLTFPKGAALKDPARLFNAGLEGKARRAIDIRENDVIDEEAFKALIRAAVALNTASRKRSGSS